MTSTDVPDDCVKINLAHQNISLILWTHLRFQSGKEPIETVCEGVLDKSCVYHIQMDQ